MNVQYHEVKIAIEFRNANELIVGLTQSGDRQVNANTSSLADGSLALTNAALWVDYVYLDTDER